MVDAADIVEMANVMIGEMVGVEAVEIVVLKTIKKSNQSIALLYIKN